MDKWNHTDFLLSDIDIRDAKKLQCEGALSDSVSMSKLPLQIQMHVNENPSIR